MKTYHDVITQVASSYNVNTRSIDGDPRAASSMCLYNDLNNGHHCAFAMFVKPEHRPKLVEGQSAKQLFEKHNFSFAFLQDDVQHLTNLNFWDDIQNLHDSSDYWNEEGLSPEGKARVEELYNFYQ